MDIEEVAEHTPEKIIRVNVHPTAGLQDFQCRQLAFGLGLEGAQIAQFGRSRMRSTGYTWSATRAWWRSIR